MIVNKNIVVVLFTILIIPSLWAQTICPVETAVFEDGDVYYALPNAFTPNNDGLNDLLILFNSAVQQKRIIVTNPADSVKLYETDEVDSAWDGLDLQGEPVPEGIYNLTVNYLFDNSSNDVAIACRTVNLVRENCLEFNEDSLDFPIDFDIDNLRFNENTVSLPDCINSIPSDNNLTIKIYPNPATDKILIESHQWIHEVNIFDCAGKLVYRQDDLFNQSIDVSGLQFGTYAIQLKSKQTQVLKMIVIQ